MTEQESKRCTRCGYVKPLNEFHISKASKDGHIEQCKQCRKEDYQKTRGAFKEYYQRNKERITAYASERARIIGHGGRASEEARQKHNDYTRQYKRGNKQKGKAHQAVKKAITAGILDPPQLLCCVRCGGAAVEYHHESYDTDRWLNVVPICHSCHMKIHNRANTG